MTDLNPNQHALLTSAAAADHGASADLFARQTIVSLTKRGYLISLPKTDGPSRLLITQAGREALAPDGGEVEGEEPTGDTVVPAPETPRTDAEAVEAPKAPTGKIHTLVTLLSRSEGARIEEMMAATGWQAHSVRGAISGTIKKTLGLVVGSEKLDGVRTYRIVEAAQ